jgi:hypothetical protein
VEGMSSLPEALAHFLKQEELTADNQYQVYPKLAAQPYTCTTVQPYNCSPLNPKP